MPVSEQNMEFWWKRKGDFFKWEMSILRVDAGSDSEDEHKTREGHFIKVRETFHQARPQ